LLELEFKLYLEKKTYKLIKRLYLVNDEEQLINKLNVIRKKKDKFVVSYKLYKVTIEPVNTNVVDEKVIKDLERKINMGNLTNEAV
jgi:hypothetical protein